MLTALKQRLFLQPGAQPFLVEGPIQFTTTPRVTQHRHALPITQFQIRIMVDEHTLELRRASLCQHGQGQIAEMAVVALVENQGQGGGSVAAA
jgi:hypothetical protein